MNAEPTAEEIIIANLAVQMLPKIELPTAWETMKPIELLQLVRQSTDASEPILLESGAMSPVRSSVEKSLTAFEVIADEAVVRARIVLASVRGEYREGRKARHQAVQDLKTSVTADNERQERWAAARAEWMAKFEKHLTGHGKEEITTMEMLRIAFPNSEDHMRALYWRDLLRTDDSSPGVAIVFEDENPPSGTHEVIPDMLDMSWPRDGLHALAGCAQRVRKHYEKHGAAIIKQWKRSHPNCVEGGEQTAKNKADQMKADAAKYGGDTVPDIADIVTSVPDAKLKKAAAKHLSTKQKVSKKAAIRGFARKLK